MSLVALLRPEQAAATLIGRRRLNMLNPSAGGIDMVDFAVCRPRGATAWPSPATADSTSKNARHARTTVALDEQKLMPRTARLSRR